MSAIGELPTFADADGTIHVVVETPRGSRAKYKFEPRLGPDGGERSGEMHLGLAIGDRHQLARGFLLDVASRERAIARHHGLRRRLPHRRGDPLGERPVHASKPERKLATLAPSSATP